MFCFYFVSAKLWTGGTIAPAKPLLSAFWWQIDTAIILLRTFLCVLFFALDKLLS